MRVFYFLAAPLVLGILTTSCASRLDDVDDKVSDLQKRTALLEQKSGMPIGSDRELLDGQKLADVRTQVMALRNEVTVLTGKVESAEFESRNLASQVKDLQGRLDAKDREMKTQVQASAGAETGMDAEYNAALKAYQDGDFEKAEGLFQAFLSRYPKSSLADNALFWLGEGAMAKKMCKTAVTRFQDLIDRFPKSDMKCEAMKNQISCLKELGMEKEAAAFSKIRGAECPQGN